LETPELMRLPGKPFPKIQRAFLDRRLRQSRQSHQCILTACAHPIRP
jgi:hypothetical protein